MDEHEHPLTRLAAIDDFGAGERVDRSRLQRALHGYAQRVSDGEVDPDTVRDGLMVTVAEDLRIVIALPEQSLGVIASAFMPVEREAAHRLAPALLKLNAHARGTGVGLFGLLPPDNDLVFCRKIPVVPDDAAQLEHDVLAFAEQAAEWADWLESLALVADGEPSAVVDLSGAPRVFV